jgi:hypothetical protein
MHQPPQNMHTWQLHSVGVVDILVRVVSIDSSNATPQRSIILWVRAFVQGLFQQVVCEPTTNWNSLCDVYLCAAGFWYAYPTGNLRGMRLAAGEDWTARTVPSQSMLHASHALRYYSTKVCRQDIVVPPHRQTMLLVSVSCRQRDPLNHVKGALVS